MLCRVSDEMYADEVEYEDPKTALGDLTLYELMGQDFDVYLKRNNKFGFDIEIDSMDGEYQITEQAIHPAAVESMADFCRRFVAFYDKSVDAKGL